MKSISQLILIVTHRCNLACRYCNIKKDKQNMPLEVAVEAVSIFLKKHSCITPFIKFFGGETLLAFPIIKKVITSAKTRSKNLKFEITTNGTFLNKNTLDFLSDNNDIELWYSHHTARLNKCDLLLKKLPDCGINILITPPEAKNLSDEFAFFWKLGFRKFNFLPAYFNLWDKEDLRILENEFRITANSINQLKKRGNKIKVKNVKTLSPTPLFNNGFVVDCNGDVFLNNLILSKHFAHLRADLKIGHIGQADKIDWHKRTDFDILFQKHLEPGIYAATINADRILTNFVTLLEQ
jgi:hypothetical protein